jgi:hypothetical protein
MWEKLRIRERDRLMGLLFVGTLLAFLGFSLLALGFPNAALAAGVCFLATLCALTARCVRTWLLNKPGRAPVGPLSPDEKLKARSKLLKPRTQS